MSTSKPSKPEVTPWFTGGSPPAYPGVYNVSCRKHDQTGHWWSRWDGYKWWAPSLDQERAVKKIDLSTAIFHRTGSWRGLAQKPEGFK